MPPRPGRPCASEACSRADSRRGRARQRRNGDQGRIRSGRAGGRGAGRRPVPAEQRDRVLRGVLDQLIGYKLLLQEARARKVAVPDAEVDARIDQIAGSFPPRRCSRRCSKQQNMTLEQVKSDARQDMAIPKMIEGEIAAKIAVTPEQVNDFYAKNPDQFKQGEQRARQPHPDWRAARAPTWRPRRRRAQGRRRAEAGEGRQGLRRARQGELGGSGQRRQRRRPGLLPAGADGRPFNEAAFTLAPGATSELVETRVRLSHHQGDGEEGRAAPSRSKRSGRRSSSTSQKMNRQQQTQAFVDGAQGQGQDRDPDLMHRSST